MTETSKRDSELERRLAAANDRIRELEARASTLEDIISASRAAYALLDDLALKINAERSALRSLVEEVVFFEGHLPKDFLARARAALERFTAPAEEGGDA